MQANTDDDYFCISKIRKVKTPSRGTPKSAGLDFFIPEDLPQAEMSEINNGINSGAGFVCEGSENKTVVTSISLAPGKSVLIPAGVKVKVPNGYSLIFFNKSGVGSKKKLDVLASVVDQDYEGEVHLNVVNNGFETQILTAGQKLVQGILLPVFYAPVKEYKTSEEMYSGSSSQRGEGGFGSTGK